MNAKEIKIGVVFHPKGVGQHDFNNRMRIVEITSLDNDGFIYWESENPKKDNRIKNHKRWNKGYCRVWFLKKYCEVLK